MNFDFLLAGIILFVIILIYAGYFYLPQRRVFYIFCAIIIVSVVSTIGFWHIYQRGTGMTEKQKMQILSEQPFFVTWYEAYKQDVEKIDRIWAQYNNIISDFQQDKISVSVMRSKMVKVENESNLLVKKMGISLPPKELSDKNYRISYDILEKTRHYLGKQNKIIKRTVDIINEKGFTREAHDVQYKKIDNMRILYAPVNLYIASDISQIRDDLSLSAWQN
ncbi:hypothetical protein [Pectinatus sottacetonis]|uniref:hypothetical protein n=1 Tax=Pectinatus sottacetonis TaxID=1002795 RepID=UPI0018C4E89A|nr:hypothetical protein [Pectinatus sottacetonis]